MGTRATTTLHIRHNFTVVLSDDEAHKILAIIGPFGGSVGGFCSSVVRDYIDLTPDQIHAFRVMLTKQADENREAARLRTLGVNPRT
jgi:hypothetical protein